MAGMLPSRVTQLRDRTWHYRAAERETGLAARQEPEKSRLTGAAGLQSDPVRTQFARAAAWVDPILGLLLGL
ncbi:hypothetical protein ColTof4_07705 [Colletotrichum tofieldiae]|nr:hypothetical protein ColTof3_02766 [Colletotrichum tofieldiae]GKT75282.1 hypothetical protein ColTof4_07705 [Colletotrichum tofieldiae]